MEQCLQVTSVISLVGENPSLQCNIRLAYLLWGITLVFEETTFLGKWAISIFRQTEDKRTVSHILRLSILIPTSGSYRCYTNMGLASIYLNKSSCVIDTFPFWP